MSDDRSWRDQIERASFRGVEFQIENHSVTFGRRGRLNEFPFADTPFAEDTGRKAREFSITAYVDGDNYLAQRDLLLNAVENDSTAGVLILPTLGDILVKPTGSNTVRYSNRQGGIEFFELSFVESGKNDFPKTTVNTKETAEIKWEALSDTLANEAFEKVTFQVKSVPFDQGVANLASQAVFGTPALLNDPDALSEETSTIMDEVNSVIDDVLRQGQKIGDDFDQFSSDFQSYKDNLRTKILAPAQFIEDTDALYDKMNDMWGTDLNDAFYGFKDIFNAQTDDIAKVVSIFGSSREQQDKNNQFTRDAIRNLTLKQMSDVTVNQTYVSTNEVRERRSEILDLYEQQIENAGINGDQKTRDALVDLRSAVVADLESKQGALPDEVELELQESVPAFTLANDLYGDGLRGEEIADSNTQINPLFMPPKETLNVLSA